MPHYEYHCSTCNKNHTDFRNIDHRKDPFTCPECKGPAEFVPFPQDSVKPEGRKNLQNVFRKV